MSGLTLILFRGLEENGVRTDPVRLQIKALDINVNGSAIGWPDRW